jgi:hypothetical protein
MIVVVYTCCFFCAHNIKAWLIPRSSVRHLTDTLPLLQTNEERDQGTKAETVVLVPADSSHVKAEPESIIQRFGRPGGESPSRARSPPTQ